MSARTTAAIAILLAIAAGGFAWLEHRRANNLQRLLAAGSAAPVTIEQPIAQAMAPTPQENHRPTEDQAAKNELLRLRGEVTRLRSEISNARNSSTNQPRIWESEAEIPEAGEATPQAAIQTFLSRLLGGKKEAVLQSVMDLDERPDSAQLLKENMDSFAEMSEAAVLGMESIRIVSERQSPDGDLQYLLLITSGDGTGAAQWITVRQVEDAYKLGLWINRKNDGVSVGWQKP